MEARVWNEQMEEGRELCAPIHGSPISDLIPVVTFSTVAICAVTLQQSIKKGKLLVISYQPPTFYGKIS